MPSQPGIQKRQVETFDMSSTTQEYTLTNAFSKVRIYQNHCERVVCVILDFELVLLIRNI